MARDSDKFDLYAAPMRIGTVTLTVRDLPAVAAFYQDVLDLDWLDAGASFVTLGAGDKALVHLRGDPSLAPRDPRQAGLFHTAFLLPRRGDLARWLAFADKAGIRLQGASDHIVSEAIYLADPEGNGIEVYADRPVSHWRPSGGEIRMATDPLDVADLLAAAGNKSWGGFPEGGLIGHVHLQVGDTAEAERFYSGVLGLDVAFRYTGANFFGSGGYHHQLAGNTWNSRGAGPRPAGMAGLETVELVVPAAATRRAIANRAQAAGLAITGAGDDFALADPWGTRIAVTG